MRRFHPRLRGRTLGALVALAVAVFAPAAAADVAAPAEERSTLAVTYVEGSSTTVDMRGVQAGTQGRAAIERKNGRSRIHLRMDALPHPQSLGAFYTTYVLWSVAPEGRATSLAEMPHGKGSTIDVTTALQTFGLVITAEPHGAVPAPGAIIVAENVARENTKGRLQTSRIEYSRGGIEPSAGHRDFATPLLVLGAHRAVDLARDAGADVYARRDLEAAETRLISLDRAWPRHGKLPREMEGVARDVMRTAEAAREAADQGREEARLDAERRTAKSQVAGARGEAQAARDRAAEARVEAARAKAAEAQADAAKERALLQVDHAREEAEQARRDKDKLQEQLFESIESVLDARREARGLVVNLSDVLFDFDRSTLTPGARERLSRLTGILLAYPGSYHLEIEGHTDSVGSKEYNLGLSVGRAESVRNYLLGAGLASARVGTAIGFGDGRPVATNATPEGRQMNRRVEIVIEDVTS